VQCMQVFIHDLCVSVSLNTLEREGGRARAAAIDDGKEGLLYPHHSTMLEEGGKEGGREGTSLASVHVCIFSLFLFIYIFIQ